MLSLLSDSLTLRNDFYEENAFMRDEEINSVLPTLSRGLNSILFAINIDNSELDSKTLDANNRSDPLPVVCKTESTTGVRKRRTRVNVISLSDDESTDQTSAARSAPTTTLSSPDSVFRDKQLSTTYDTNNSSMITNQSLDRTVVLTPFDSENVDNLELIVDSSGCDFDKLSVSDNQDLQKLESSHETSSNAESIADKTELERSRAEIQYLKDKYEDKLTKLLSQNDSLHKDNELLQIQLNKYIAAVQLLKYSAKEDTHSVANPSQQSFESTKAFEAQNESYFSEINEYEKKLVEVAEMHAELVEFNQHLHRVIAQKDNLITRLKHELVHLRGPVCLELIQ
jgi:sorting nexin-29